MIKRITSMFIAMIILVCSMCNNSFASENKKTIFKITFKIFPNNFPNNFTFKSNMSSSSLFLLMVINIENGINAIKKPTNVEICVSTCDILNIKYDPILIVSALISVKIKL